MFNLFETALGIFLITVSICVIAMTTLVCLGYLGVINV